MAKANMAFAQKIGRKMPADWDADQARDYLDQATGAELDTLQLDLMVDWAIKERNRYLACLNG